MKEEISNKNFQVMAKKWPSNVCARKKISKFSGGLYTPAYMANLDSQGKGPIGRIKVGRQIAYEISSLIEWLESRCRP